MLFIPAIDLIDGKCVRLLQGDYKKKTLYSNDPEQTALTFQEQGAPYLHVVDLDAARDGKSTNNGVIKRIVRSVNIPVEVGGGVRDKERIKALLGLGVDRVILGTIVVRAPSRAQDLVGEFGVKLAAGIDARDSSVRISGWTEESNIGAIELGKRVKDMGFSLIVYTDISKDGMMRGPNIHEVKEMATETGLPVIVAGGISSIEDVMSMKPLEQHGVIGVISGKAVYEGRVSVAEACRVLCNSR